VTAALYPCRITHARRGSVRRAFSYGSYLWLIDPEDPPALPRALRPLASFRAADHLGAPGLTITENVSHYLASHGTDLAGGKILMLANARTLGHAFNPLTVFWCYAADGRLAAVLAEVHNTYRQRHVYLLHPDEAGRASAGKTFYVSPFLPMAGRYRMRLPEPGEDLRLDVTLEIDGRPVLAASVRGSRRPCTTAGLLRCQLRYPWGAARVSLLIRWQALWLLARRQPIFRRPAHQPQEGVQ
jgi:DUF1365 family protein